MNHWYGHGERLVGM